MFSFLESLWTGIVVVVSIIVCSIVFIVVFCLGIACLALLAIGCTIVVGIALLVTLCFWISDKISEWFYKK